MWSSKKPDREGSKSSKGDKESSKSKKRGKNTNNSTRKQQPNEEEESHPPFYGKELYRPLVPDVTNQLSNTPIDDQPGSNQQCLATSSGASQSQSQTYSYSEPPGSAPMDTGWLPDPRIVPDDASKSYSRQIPTNPYFQFGASPSQHYKKDKEVPRDAPPNDYRGPGYSLPNATPQAGVDSRYLYEESVPTGDDGYEHITSAQDKGYVYVTHPGNMPSSQSDRKGKRRDSFRSPEQSAPPISASSGRKSSTRQATGDEVLYSDVYGAQVNPSATTASLSDPYATTNDAPYSQQPLHSYSNAYTGDATGHTSGYQQNTYREPGVNYSTSSAKFGVLLDGTRLRCEGKRSTLNCLVSREMVRALCRENDMVRFEKEVKVYTSSKSSRESMATIELNWQELDAENVVVQSGVSQFFVCRDLPKNQVYLSTRQ